MTRSVIPSEDCVFRLDSDFGYRQQFPMTFDGVGLSDAGFILDGGKILYPVDIRYNLYGSFTFEASVEFDDSLAFNVIFGTGIGASSSARTHFLSKNSDGKFVYQWSSDGEIATVDNLLTGNTYDDSLHHIALTFDNGEVSMYIDGVLDGNKSSSTTSVYQPTAINYIGNSAWADGSNGIIKSASIYNRALTAQEVADRHRDLTFQFKNETPTPTQQAYIDWEDGLKCGR